MRPTRVERSGGRRHLSSFQRERGSRKPHCQVPGHHLWGIHTSLPERASTRSFSAEFIASKPFTVWVSRVFFINRTSTPLNASLWGKRDPVAVGSISERCRPSTTPGRPRRPRHSNTCSVSTTITLGRMVIGLPPGTRRIGSCLWTNVTPDGHDRDRRAVPSAACRPVPTSNGPGKVVAPRLRVSSRWPVTRIWRVARDTRSWGVGQSDAMVVVVTGSVASGAGLHW